MVLAWRNAAWFGLDRFVLRRGIWTRNRHVGGAAHGRVVPAIT